jgi:small subunit ribosomal protein S18
MARNNDRERSTRRSPKETVRRGKKKVCVFCKEHVEWVDYKDIGLLRKYMSERGKIRARRVSGNCAQHQRDVALAIKTAREMALLPYTQRTTSDRPNPRAGGRGDRGREGADAPVESDDGVLDLDLDLDLDLAIGVEDDEIGTLADDDPDGFVASGVEDGA